jgi:GntR family transcriptional regulator
MRLRVDSDRALPPSGQIVETVLDAVASGDLEPGARLPRVREAAAEALVNPNTVARAWRDLEAMGVVEGRAGSGVFVTEKGPDVARRERRRETLASLRQAAAEALRAGHAEEDVLEEVRRAIARAARGTAVAVSEGKGGRS